MASHGLPSLSPQIVSSHRLMDPEAMYGPPSGTPSLKPWIVSFHGISLDPIPEATHHVFSWRHMDRLAETTDRVTS